MNGLGFRAGAPDHGNVDPDHFFCSLLRAGAGVLPQFPLCLGEQLPVLHKLRARLYPGLGIMVPYDHSPAFFSLSSLHVSVFFRYYFKKVSDEFDCGVVFEEVREDDTILPIFEEKIIGKVEKID